MQLKSILRYVTAGNAALAVFLFLALPAAAQVAVSVDGNEVDFSPAPIIQAGRVFVPLRGVFERLGASVVYSSGTINATGNGRTISLQIGSTQATVNGQPQTLDVAPFIIGASTFVPLRFVSQALGASVNWDETDHLVSIATVGAPPPAYAGYAPEVDEYASVAPPPIPDYEQPYAPAPDYIWQPGYWAWGPYGYYWVPGTWVQAPQPGYLWTPGYWAFDGGRFAFNNGYWATSVGFYGGVNYGAGYYGSGYVGGRWSGNNFAYNTYVTRVDTTIVHNVYVDRTVNINTTTRTSYNGGPNGLSVRPRPEELAVAKAHHLPMTAAQVQHVKVAAQDRRLLASVNHNKPPVLAVAKPLSASNPPAGLVPVKPSDKVAAPPPVAAKHAAPKVRAAPAAPAPVEHPVHTAAPAAPAVHATPATHETHVVPVPPATVKPQPAVHPAPPPPAEAKKPAPPPPAETKKPAPPPPAEAKKPAPPPPAEAKKPAPPPPAETKKPAPEAKKPAPEVKKPVPEEKKPVPETPKKPEPKPT